MRHDGLLGYILLNSRALRSFCELRTSNLVRKFVSMLTFLFPLLLQMVPRGIHAYRACSVFIASGFGFNHPEWSARLQVQATFPRHSCNRAVFRATVRFSLKPLSSANLERQAQLAPQPQHQTPRLDLSELPHEKLEQLKDEHCGLCSICVTTCTQSTTDKLNESSPKAPTLNPKSKTRFESGALLHKHP